MSDTQSRQVIEAARWVNGGGVIAYPTESCFGIGCNPRDYRAVKQILQLKRRSAGKGMILIGNDLVQLLPYMARLSDESIDQIRNSWPAAITWLVPAASWVPRWLKGNSEKIALRVPDHKLARAVCRKCGHALVSTSANKTGSNPYRTAGQVNKIFGAGINYIVNARTGGATAPSTIIDLKSGQIIR